MQLCELQHAYRTAIRLLATDTEAALQEARRLGGALAEAGRDPSEVGHQHHEAVLAEAAWANAAGPRLPGLLDKAYEALKAGYRGRVTATRAGAAAAGGGAAEVAPALARAVQSMPLMLAAFDADWRVVYWNSECERVTGYTADEAVGTPGFLELLYPDPEYRRSTAEEWARLAGDFREREFGLVAKGGAVRTVAWSSIAAQHPIEGWATWGVGVDVTAQRRAEEALRDSEQLYRSLVETTSEGYWLVGPDGLTLGTNHALREMLGYAHGELVGRSPAEFASPEGRECVARSISSMAQEPHRGYETMFRAKDGRDVHVRVSASTLVDHAGSVRGSFALLTDITERKQAEAALRESEEKFATLFDANPEASALTEPSTGRFVDVNQAFCDTTGLGREQVIGRSSVELGIMTEEDRDEWVACVAASRGVARHETRVFHPTHGPRHGLLSAQTVRVGGRELILSVVMDITELKQAELALRESEAKFVALFNANPACVSLSDPDTGAFLDVNDAFCETIGITKAEAIGRTSTELGILTPEARREWREHMSRTGGLTRHEMPFHNRVRGLRYGLFSAQVVTIGGRELILTTVTDITERREAEAALRESEAQFSALFEANPAAVALADASTGQLVAVNATFCDLVGLSREEALGHTSVELGILTAEDRDRWLDQLGASGGMGRHEMAFRHRTRGPRYGLFSAQTTAIGGKRLVMSVATDITDRKEAEAALRESEARFATLFNSNPVSSVLSEARTGLLVAVNPAFGDMHGFPPEEAIGHTSLELGIVTSEDRRGWMRHIESGRGMSRYEMPFRHPTLGLRYGLFSSQMVTVDGRELLLSVGTDITDRKQSEDLYRSLFEQSSDAVFVHTLDGKVLHANSGAAALLDFDRELLQAMAIPDALGGGSSSVLARLGESGTARFGARLTRAGGRVLEVEGDARVIDRSRGIAQMVVRDVTDHRREERERRARLFALESMELIERAVRGTEDAEQMLSDFIRQVFHILRCDRAWLMYPCDPDADECVVPFEHTHPDYPGASQFADPLPMEVATSEACRVALETGAPVVEMEKPPVRLGGLMGDELRVYSRIATAVHPKVGRPWLFGAHQCAYRRQWTQDEVDLFQDIGRRLADALSVLLTVRELRESEGRLATILNTVQAAVLIVDAEADEVQYANPAALALLGATETEVVGCSSRRFFWARPRDGGAADEPGQPLERSETTVRRANGEECTVLRTVTPTTLGGRDCLVIAFLDMTELKRAEDAQRLATVGQLAAGVAHEFNNILAILGGRAQLAEALGTDEEHGKLVDAVLRGTQRGAAICAELTRFSKPQAPRRERIRLEDPLEAALGIAERHVSAAAVDVSRHYDAGGRTAYADPGQLEQVFLNLIINACHAMPGGGTLSLAVTPAPGEEAHDDGLLVTVADTGTGISPEHIQRVFEPFFTTKGRLGGSDVPGTGLGLSVSHGIVVAHGGRITARSEVGVGTTFEVWLPATTAEPSATLAETGASIGPPAEAPSGLRILVADDEEDIRGMLVDLLSGQGHSVTSVADAQQATAALNEATFDAVLTDLLMPGGGGRRVLEVAQHLPVAPPVLVLTGRGEVEVAEEMLGLGATACLRKPLDLGEVLAALGGANRA